ncbi:putative transcription factor TIFY family [Helianthus annuus]|nr:putative transcription factor TIFY family [Helianthus annuus]KAJ0897535.1 putative transcription factor TIFY family [Helianthus annuus]
MTKVDTDVHDVMAMDVGATEKPSESSPMTTSDSYDDHRFIEQHRESRSKNAQTEKLMNAKPDETTNKAQQMTIFYHREVIVFDNIPADRARDLMLAAKDYPSSTGKTNAHDYLIATSNFPYNARESDQPIDHLRVQANGLDLLIARRASLNKFLAKRKDRATVQAPYPSPGAGPSMHELNFDINM